MIWNKKDIESDLVRELSARYNLDLMSSSILIRRGRVEPEELCFFLEDDKRFLHNPFLLEEMEAAVERINSAVEEGEKVLIFGDRDVDGITSTVLLYEMLTGKGIGVEWALPLGDDPYGLTKESVEECVNQAVTLIITVDCGISNHQEISYAKEAGIDTIVIDHHNPRDVLPPAYAIINPKLKDSAYPFRDLCGCAVVSKLVWALCFSETDLYNREVCLLNILPENEAYTVEAVKLVNLVEKQRISETIVPGVVPIEQTRLVDFLGGVEIYVYNREQQLRMLQRIFGSEAIINLFDLAEPIWNLYPRLKDKSLLGIRELSKIVKYRSTFTGELDVLINLFTTLVLKQNKDRFSPFNDNLDLVALGTIADLMPLENENRILVRSGMGLLSSTTREGLYQLLLRQGLAGKKLSTTDIAWQISPLINATGRMGVPDRAVRLLLSRDAAVCEELAEEVVSLNKKRKKLGDDTWENIRHSAQASHDELGGKMVIVGDKDIHRGITGILATRLVKYFNTTTAVLAFMNDKAVGSLRGDGSFKVSALLTHCAELFQDWGGHDYAAGFNMELGNFPRFKQMVQDYLETIKIEETEEETIEIDAELPLSYMTPELIEKVEFFEPYGQGNSPLVFLLKGAKIAELSLVGKTEKQHVRMLVDTGKFKWPGVFWNASERVGRDFSLDDTVDLLFRLGRNYFQNTETLQLTILDIQK